MSVTKGYRLARTVRHDGACQGCAESGKNGPILAQELIRFLSLFRFVSS